MTSQSQELAPRAPWHVELTARQAALGVMALCATGAGLTLLTTVLTGGGAGALVMGVAAVLTTALGVGYWRTGWRAAPTVLLVALTLLTMVIPEPYVSEKLTLAVMIPSLLALMLLNVGWVIAAGLAVLVVLVARAGGAGPLGGDPVMVALYLIAIAIMVAARLVMSTAQRRAERSAAAAASALAVAEQQARDLAAAGVAMRDQLAEQQRLLDLVATLEVPLIQIADGVLLAPIVGHLDSRRAQTFAARLLTATHRARARFVILDIAAVSVMDTGVAHALMDVAQGLRLLGCTPIFSGISSAVAVSIADLGVRLDDMLTVRTPQEALVQIAEDTRPLAPAQRRP